MKKAIAMILAVLIFVCAFAGCGEPAETSAGETTETSAAVTTEAETAAAPIETSTGPLTVTTSSGAELTLTPIETAAFDAQDEYASVKTRIGNTMFTGGAVALPGSGLFLSDVMNTTQFAKSRVAFTYESALEADAVYDAIAEVGESAVLSIGGNEYAVEVAWITDAIGCFVFNASEPVAELPAFGTVNGNLYIEG